jgi:hypothetical protein
MSEALVRGTVPLWPAAGQRLGLNRTMTYLAASRGEIRTLRFGRRLVVPVKWLDAILDGTLATAGRAPAATEVTTNA